MSSSRPVNPTPIECTVPQVPAVPQLHFEVCSDKVCLDIASAKQLAAYQHAVAQEQEALAGCHFIIWQ